MSRLSRASRGLGLAVGWVLLIIGALVWGLELSGFLTHLVEDQLKRRLSPLGGELSLEHARLAWFTPALELSGFRIGGDESVSIEECAIELGWSPGAGVHVERADIRGGSLVVSQTLMNGIRGLMRGAAESEPGAARRRSPLPSIYVSDLGLEVEYPGVGRIPVGRVEVVFEDSPGNKPQLRGHVVPELAAGPAGAPQIYMHGREVAPAILEVFAYGENLTLSEDLQMGGALRDLRPYAANAVLSLETRATMALDEGRMLEGTTRVVLREGSLAPPFGDEHVENLRLELEARYAPSAEQNIWDPNAWNTKLAGEGSWKEVDFRLGGLLGGALDGPQVADAWLSAPGIEYSDVVTLLGEPRTLRGLENIFAPRGQANFCVGLRCPADWEPAQDPLANLEFVMDVECVGETGMRYHGWPTRETGAFDRGLPLPIDGLEGHMLFTFHPRHLRRALFAIPDLEGRHQGGGRVWAEGLVSSLPDDVPPSAPGHGKPEMYLRIQALDADLDQQFEEALEHFSGIIPPESLWKRYNPSAGQVDLDINLWRGIDFRGVASRVGIDLEDVAMTWAQIPIPISGVGGRVEYRNQGATASGGRGRAGVSYRAEGLMRTADRLELAGRQERLPTGPDSVGNFSVMQARVERLSLVGADMKILEEIFEAIRTGLGQLGAKGFSDLGLVRIQALPDGPVDTLVEVVPSGAVELKPERFEMIAKEVRGRVIATVHEPAVSAGGAGGDPSSSTPQVEARLWPLVGLWGKDVPVACLAEVSADASIDVKIFGAGIDVSNRSLLGSLSEAMRSETEETALEPSALSLDGRADFSGSITSDRARGTEEGGQQVESKYYFHFRNNHLTSRDGFSLSELRGKLEFSDGVLNGEQLTAVLGGTPVQLLDPHFQNVSEGWELRTELSAQNLPLDRHHLKYFLDEETLDALVDELEWRGRIDVEHGRLLIQGGGERTTRQSLSGDLLLSDVFLRIGVPLSIRSARARIEELIFEGGRVRGWGRLEDLYGQLADRNLGPASMLMAYYDTHLTIEDLDSEFEGGTLRSLGGAGRGAGLAGALALTAPFRFQLALELGGDGKGADVQGVLRGLFSSNIANTGVAQGNLRLRGDFENLSGIQGSGWMRVRRTVLWSIPLVQELLATLGLDESAAQFDRLETRFDVRDGEVAMHNIDVESDIMHLVGEGTLGFDGELSYDLQIQYSLINKLGPFRRLLYLVQNSLLSISIRGTMARPKVFLNSLISDIIARKSEFRALPLPDYSPLPNRF